MKKGEYYREGWDNDPSNPVYVIELDNGCHVFASRDYEGNSGGAMFGYDSANNESFTIAIDRKQPVDTSKMNNDEFGEYLRNQKTKEGY